MNKVILMGRLTKDPEIRYGKGDKATAICKYSLAVNRSYKRDGEPDADFINIIAFGKRGEFAAKYFKKGMMVSVVGELRTGSYTDKDGIKRYTTDVVVSEQFFAEAKKSGGGNTSASREPDFAPYDSGTTRGYQPPKPAPADDGFKEIYPVDEDLPF